MSKLNTYYFEGTRWIPGYNDFDYDEFTTEAVDEKQAWENLHKAKKNWTRVGLTEINGVKQNETSNTETTAN